MAHPDKPLDLEKIAIGVPVTLRMRDAISAYGDAHPDSDGKAPSNADLLRRAIASVIKYDLRAEQRELDKWSERHTYATEEERIQARKDAAARAKADHDAAMAIWRNMDKEAQAKALRASLERSK